MSHTSAEPGGGFVERMKGKVKQVTGSLLDNEQLREEGEIHEDKADALEEARRRDAEAAQARAEAELDAKEQAIAIEHQELVAEETTEARGARIEQERRLEEQRIALEHEDKKGEVERQEELQKQAIRRDEAMAAQEWSQERREAQQAESEAERARAAADVLGRAAESE